MILLFQALVMTSMQKWSLWVSLFIFHLRFSSNKTFAVHFRVRKTFLHVPHPSCLLLTILVHSHVRHIHLVSQLTVASKFKSPLSPFSFSCQACIVPAGRLQHLDLRNTYHIHAIICHPQVTTCRAVCARLLHTRYTPKNIFLNSPVYRVSGCVESVII